MNLKILLIIALLPPFFTMGLAEECLERGLFIEVGDFCFHYMITSVTVAVCAERMIPLDTIIALIIVLPPAFVNSLPFYNCTISSAKVSANYFKPDA